jgi:hypothetical protein
MFKRMNSGLMHAASGIPPQCQHVGLLMQGPDARLGPNSGIACELGPAGTPYYLAEPGSEAMGTASRLFDVMLATVSECSFVGSSLTMSSYLEVDKFAEELVTLATKLRNLRVDGNVFEGARSPRMRILSSTSSGHSC